MSNRKHNEIQVNSQKSDGDFPSELETAVWVSLNLAQKNIYKHMDAVLKERGLPPLRWYDILWAIESSSDKGIQAFKLKQGLLFEQSNLSRLLRKIIEEGLVEEAVFEQDRRGKLLRITAKGKETRKQMWEIYGPMIHAHMKKIPRRNQERMTSLLDLLHDGWPDDFFGKK